MKSFWRTVEPYIFSLVYYWGWYKFILIHQWKMDKVDAAVLTILIVIALFGFIIYRDKE